MSETPIEVAGLLPYNRGGAGQELDLGVVRDLARRHEAAGYDRVLIAQSSASPDPTVIATFVSQVAPTLGLLLAHRPGTGRPTVTARAFATLDRVSEGRLWLHIITGGNDAEQRRDGDDLDKAGRYRRTAEYIGILRRAWTSTERFSHSGEFYRFDDFVSDVIPYREDGIPLSIAGSSPQAHEVGARFGDLAALFGQPLDQFAEEAEAIRRAARAAGRERGPSLSASFRPILADTDDAAWRRAEAIGRRLADASPGDSTGFFDPGQVSDGTRRQLEAARRGERHGAVWTEPARLTGGRGNSTAVVGSPATVARTLGDYVALGVTRLILTGFDDDDTERIGHELIPLIRGSAGERRG